MSVLTESIEMINESFFAKYEIMSWLKNAKDAIGSKKKEVCKKLLDKYKNKLSKWKDDKYFIDNKQEIYNIVERLCEVGECDKSQYISGYSKKESVDIKKAINDIKSIEKKIISYDEVIKKAEETYNKYVIKNKDFDDNDIKPTSPGNKYLPKLIAEDEGDDYVIIIDHDQMVRIAYSWIIDIIIDELHKLPEYKDIHISDGDGDEGCIYFR